MKKLINYWEALLLTTTIVFTICFFTLCNKRFIYHELDKHEYYKEVKTDINKHYKDCNISYKQVKTDIDRYVSHNYSVSINNPKSCINDNYYEYKIKFNNVFNNIDVDLYINLIFIISIVLVSITGITFKKTKKLHDIKLIGIISSILLTFIYGIIKIFVSINNNIINTFICDASKYLLIIASIILSIRVFRLIKSKLIK